MRRELMQKSVHGRGAQTSRRRRVSHAFGLGQKRLTCYFCAGIIEEDAVLRFFEVAAFPPRGGVAQMVRATDS